MTKRVCETCRFAKAAGFDNMGWCTHPKLQLGSDVKVLVRLNSLHCRNGWANDLWQPAEAREYGDAEPALAQPLSPASPDELSAVLGASERPAASADPMEAAARGEDVVVGEATVVGGGAGSKSFRLNLKRAHEEMKARKREVRPSFVPDPGDWRAAGAPAAVDPPVAVREAVEEMDQRPRQADEELPDSGFASAAIDRPATERKPLPPRPIIGEVSPVELGEIGRPFPKMTHFPEDDARFSSIPEPVPGFELPLAGKPEKRREVKRAGFDSDQFDFPSWAQDEETRPAEATGAATGEPDNPAAARPEPGWHDAGEPLRDATSRRSGASTWGAQAAADAEIERSFPALPDFLAGQEEYEPPRRIPRQRVEPARPERTRRFEREPVDLVLADPPHEVDRFDSVDVQEEAEAVEEAGPIVAGTDDVAQLRWADIPRMCRTCRDFRPAESGDRGWCTNKRAFSHRRMVDADELPCESSIGRWWLPNDDFWLSTLDVSAHSQPTPLFDAWIAQRVARSGGYEEDAPIRRRKRS